MTRTTAEQQAPAADARRYKVVIWYDDAEDCWVAEVPELHGNSYFGICDATEVEALAHIRALIPHWLAAGREVGIVDPAPGDKAQLDRALANAKAGKLVKGDLIRD